jgi:hypothetical protein
VIGLVTGTERRSRALRSSPDGGQKGGDDADQPLFELQRKLRGGHAFLRRSLGRKGFADHDVPGFADGRTGSSQREGHGGACPPKGRRFHNDGLGCAGRPLQQAAGVDTPEEAERVFEALSKGGNVGMPIAKTFWAKRFGMVTDRFGTHWMVNCE